MEDGDKEPPQIVALSLDTKADRRGFLGAGMAAASALLALSGCATKNVAYKTYDESTKTWRYFTLPCGSAIPPGAVCTCNCVPAASSTPSYGTRTICTCNKVCTCVPVYRSDRQTKGKLADINEAEILNRLAQLPVQSWSYIDEAVRVRHIGPMAQDFAAAFGVGDSDKHIHVADAIGVALASIRELHRLTLAQQQEIAELRKALTEGTGCADRSSFSSSHHESNQAA